jgi:hypothetical protein
MRTIPIRVESLTGFICAYAPEPNTDRVTGEVRKDRVTGQDQYLVGVMVTYRDPEDAAARPESVVLTVQVPASGATGLAEGERVRVHDLIARPWDREGRSGVTYRASAVTAASAPAPAPAVASPRADAPAAGRASGKAAGS